MSGHNLFARLRHLPVFCGSLLWVNPSCRHWLHNWVHLQQAQTLLPPCCLLVEQRVRHPSSGCPCCPWWGPQSGQKSSLRKAIIKAKCEWGNDIVSNATNEDFWRVTTPSGTTVDMSLSTAILTNHRLLSDEPTKAGAFKAHFFNAQPTNVLEITPSTGPIALIPIT